MYITDIIGLIGYLGLTSALILCAVIVLITLWLHFKPSKNLEKLAGWLTHTQTLLLALAVLALGILLQMGAYEYEVVFNAIEENMTPLERFGGLWAGQASSLLFWSFIMSCAVSLSLRIAKRIGKETYIPTILLALELTLLFFLIPDVFFANPFVKVWMHPSGAISTSVFPPDSAILVVSTDGQGMNPSLRHIAMLLHPPTLYLGLIGFFIPYAFLLAALLRGENEFIWVRPLFPLVLASWFFLTLGMFLGSWWAYTILGWGGYWGWDAVEISGLLPWLLSFGLIHSIRMQLRGLEYRRWIAIFSAGITLLTMFGILITRSGLLESVHAYASGAMGPALTTLILMHLLAVVFLFARELDTFKKPLPFKESIYIDRITRLFNICLVGLVLIYLFGQTLPLTSQLFGAESLSFNASQYEIYSSPLLIILIVLTALCPFESHGQKQPLQTSRGKLILLLAASALPAVLLFVRFPLSLLALMGFWVASFLLMSWLAALWRDYLHPIITKRKPRVRLGVLILHIGLAIMALGIMGVETLSSVYEGMLVPGESAEMGTSTVSAGTPQEYLDPEGNLIFELPVQLMSGSKASDLLPAIIHYTKLGTLYSHPAIAYSWLQDAQVIMKDLPEPPNRIYPLRVTFFPLISWIWAGGGLMALGGLLGILRKKK